MAERQIGTMYLKLNSEEVKVLRLSIRYKILIAVTTLLVAGLGIHLMLAVQTFKKDKTELTFELNKTAVTTLATEIQSAFHGAVDKLTLFTIIISQSKDPAEQIRFRKFLEDDPFLVYVGLFQKIQGSELQLKTEIAQKQFLEMYELTQKFYTSELTKVRPVPAQVTDSHEPLVWNATISEGPPLVGLAVPIQGTQLVALAYLRTSSFLKNASQEKLLHLFAIDSEGGLLIHPNKKLLAQNRKFSSPLIDEFKSHNSTTAVMKYKAQSHEYLGAFSHVDIGGIGVVSQVESGHAFASIDQMVKRSLVIGLVICTITFLLTILFSRSLTDPLRKLMAVMRDVSKGKLDTEIHLKTNDEIGILAKVFNQMTGELKLSRSNLEEANRDLEKKVKERTFQLEELAIRDALTGLYNRRFFNERIKEELGRAKRGAHALSIVYFDIDHFKKYNDQNGHPAGDALLKDFSKLLLLNLRKTDVLARIGGEEFCAILPETKIEGAILTAEKLRAAVEFKDFPNGEKQPLGRVTCSLGVSTYPACASDEESLIKVADEALYQCKEGGRNRVCLAKILDMAS
jgi:diguanylate cyclase (GGDEF)-like protein